MTAKRRRWLLGLGLALTCILVWFAPQDEEQVPRPRTGTVQRAQGMDADISTGSSSVVRPRSDPMRSDQLVRHDRTIGSDIPDLFKPTSWYVPPPPPPPAPPVPQPPPAVPTAPALPFVYMGQIIDDQQVQVILAHGNRVVTAIVGDIIEKSYRLESVKGGLVTFVYMPLDIKQTLATGLAP